MLWHWRRRRRPTRSTRPARPGPWTSCASSSWTPLHYAAAFQGDKPELVHYLLSKGADAAHEDEDGDTALDAHLDESDADTVVAGLLTSVEEHDGYEHWARARSVRRARPGRAPQVRRGRGAPRVRRPPQASGGPRRPRQGNRSLRRSVHPRRTRRPRLLRPRPHVHGLSAPLFFEWRVSL